MTRKQALQDLLAKVEAGSDQWSGHAVFVAFGQHKQRDFAKAMDGSLDAAKALHEAVLPGWHWVIGDDGEAEITEKSPSIPRYSRCYVEKSGNPARSWLCAILKALIAGCE